MTSSVVVSEERSKQLLPFFSAFPVDTSSIEFNYDVLNKNDNEYLIELSVISDADTSKTTIERVGSLLHADDNILTEVYGNICFISWVSEPGYDGQENEQRTYELYLKALNIKTGKELFTQKIYSTKCCIDRLSMKYNPFTKSLLFAFNDFSKSDEKYLMFGAIAIEIISFSRKS